MRVFYTQENALECRLGDQAASIEGKMWSHKNLFMDAYSTRPGFAWGVVAAWDPVIKQVAEEARWT